MPQFTITTKGSDQSVTVESFVTAKALARKFSQQYGRTFTITQVATPEFVLMDSPSILDFHIANGSVTEDVTIDWDYDEYQSNHVCTYQETPDGMGCVTCLYT